MRFFRPVFSAALTVTATACAACGGESRMDAGANIDASQDSGIDTGVACLLLTGSSPEDGATDVPLTAYGSDDAQILLAFSDAVAPASISVIRLEESGVEVPDIVARLGADDPALVYVTVLGGYASATTYVLTIPAGEDGVTGITGLQMCQEETITFSTASS